MRRYFGMAVLLVLFVWTGVTPGLAENVLIFPLVVFTANPCVADCEYWVTFASVFNPNTQPATVTFTTYDSAGNITASSGMVSAGAYQSTTLLPSSVSLRTGWLQVTSSQPLIGREYLQFYRVSSGLEDLRSRVSLPSSPLTRRYVIMPESFGPIGISIVFPSADSQSSARGKLIHRETDGSTVFEKDLVIPRNGQLIAYLRDLIPQASSPPSGPPPEPLQGSFEIVFDQDFAITVLQFSASQPLEEPVDALAGAVASQ